MNENNRKFVAPAVTFAILGVWVALASRSPHLTYHFAPLLAGAAWPVLKRTYGPVSTTRASKAAFGAFVSTVIVGLVLTATDRLEGPTLWDRGHAFWEVLIFAAIAAAWAMRAATREHGGILSSLLRD